MSSAYPPGGGRPVLPCPRCGKAIRPDEARCSNCGLQVAPLPLGPVSGSLRGGPQGQPPTWNAGPGPFAPQASRPGVLPPQPQQTRRPPTQPLQGQQGPISYPGPGMNGGNVSGVFPTASVTPSRPFPGSIYASGSAAPPSFAPPVAGKEQDPFGNRSNWSPPRSFEPRAQPDLPRRRSKPKGVIAVGIALLLVLLAGIGIAGFALANAQNNGNTSGTPIVPTPKGQPLFRDAFANNANGWDTQSDPGHFAATVGNGSLSLEDDEHTLLWELLPGGKSYGDFQLSVDATLTKGDANNAYGIYMRGAANKQSQLASYYRFSLYGDGSFAVFKGSVDANGVFKSSRLVDYMKSDAIKKQGQVNHITILAHGSSMTFVVNRQLLKVVTDSSYTSGSIALFVANLPDAQPGAQATFAQLTLYPYQN